MAIERVMAWIRNERRVRRGIRELSQLDDRMLADIGLTRGNVMDAARDGRLPVKDFIHL
jgi:uncharacterized protein YjiS (DUF1127 family)